MPILHDTSDNKVLGREFKKGIEQGLQEGALAFLRRQIAAKFGSTPAWAEERLATLSAFELEETAVSLLKAASVEELLNSPPGE
jgi:hypothetical protein